MLCGIEPLVEINEDVVLESLNSTIDSEFISELNLIRSDVLASLERDLTADELHRLQSTAYTNIFIEE